MSWYHRGVQLHRILISDKLAYIDRVICCKKSRDIIILVQFGTPFQRILVITATNRNGQNLNGHKPERPQTGTATNRNGHKPERPQTRTATNRNGRKPKRPQTRTATNRNSHKPERPQTRTAIIRNRHNFILFSGLQICVLHRSFKQVSRYRQ